jgi:methyl-accepting chemotaxis protein
MDLDTQTRLRFFRIDQDTRVQLREFWPKVQPEIDGILKSFYEHLRGFPEVQALVGDSGQVDRLIQAQKRHWQALFAADFDESFMDRVRRIGRAHYRIGLHPRWYIGAYGLLLERLQEIVDRTAKRSGDKRRTLSACLVKAVFIDMDLAISVYQAADAEARDARTNRIGSAVARVDGSVRGILDGVADGLAKVDEAGRSVAGAAAETSRRADSATAAAERATRNVETVASASEELSASIQEINQQIAQSSRLADDSMRKANRANESVGSLSEAAGKIGDVVALINDIASQTNLLALNATIEAARAGEAGRGFAVVANEVKTLAGQTAQATEEISGQVAAMQSATGRTVEDIRTIVSAIDEINRVATAISAAMEQQSAATGEIARNIHEAVSGTSEVSGDIAVVGENARNAGSASDEAHRAVEELSRSAKALRDQIEGFFADIRSA